MHYLLPLTAALALLGRQGTYHDAIAAFDFGAQLRRKNGRVEPRQSQHVQAATFAAPAWIHARAACTA